MFSNNPNDPYAALAFYYAMQSMKDEKAKEAQEEKSETPSFVKTAAAGATKKVGTMLMSVGHKLNPEVQLVREHAL